MRPVGVSRRPRRQSSGHDGDIGEVAMVTVKGPDGACKLLRIRGDAVRTSRLKAWFRFSCGRWGFSGGHGDMVMTARCMVALRGSSGVVTACA